MSSPKARPDRRAALVGLGLAAGLALALSGCFQPLYGTGSGDLQAELQAIAVDPIPDRFGHYLGNELIFALNGTGSTVTPKYRLLITYRLRSQTPIIDTVTGRADSATVFADVDYRLVPAAGGGDVALGSVGASADYDRFSQRYANIAAARDTEIRLAKTVADMVRTRLAATLAARGS